MTKKQAIERIVKRLSLPFDCEDYVIQTIGRLGCGDKIDLETANVIEEVVRRELRS